MWVAGSRHYQNPKNSEEVSAHFKTSNENRPFLFEVRFTFRGSKRHALSLIS